MNHHCKGCETLQALPRRLVSSSVDHGITVYGMTAGGRARS
jgi:hypothetical protein